MFMLSLAVCCCFGRRQQSTDFFSVFPIIQQKQQPGKAGAAGASSSSGGGAAPGWLQSLGKKLAMNLTLKVENLTVQYEEEGAGVVASAYIWCVV